MYLEVNIITYSSCCHYFDMLSVPRITGNVYIHTSAINDLHITALPVVGVQSHLVPTNYCVNNNLGNDAVQ